MRAKSPLGYFQCSRKRSSGLNISFNFFSYEAQRISTDHLFCAEAQDGKNRHRHLCDVRVFQNKTDSDVDQTNVSCSLFQSKISGNKLFFNFTLSSPSNQTKCFNDLRNVQRYVVSCDPQCAHNCQMPGNDQGSSSLTVCFLSISNDFLFSRLPSAFTNPRQPSLKFEWQGTRRQTVTIE